MRALVGVSVDGRVVEMVLPDDVALAHLLPEILDEVGISGRVARRVNGSWLDLEQSLAEQHCAPGSVICLEDPVLEDRVAVHYDPVTELGERAPPIEVVPSSAMCAVAGGIGGAGVALCGPVQAVLTVAVAPLVWAILPTLGGVASVRSVARIQRVIRMLALTAGAAALAASGPVLELGRWGVLLVGCVAGAVVLHVAKRHVSDPLARVLLSGLEWWLLGANAPFALLAIGWRW